MTRAIAKQIGNSSKEQIIVDGEVFLKSVGIGRWNYVVEVTLSTGEKWIGKSATLKAAGSWTPFPMFYEVCAAAKSDSQERKDQVRQRIADYTAKYGEPVRKNLNGWPVYRWPLQYTRKVTKIER